MRMRLFTVNSNMSVDQPEDAKTHSLHFRPVTPAGAGMGPSFLATPSSLVLSVTKSEADTYELGAMYNVGAELSADQQLTQAEQSMDVKS